jgi:hypothetical protein
MRDEKAPPTNKSTVDFVVCQSSDGIPQPDVARPIPGAPDFLNWRGDFGFNYDFRGGHGNSFSCLVAWNFVVETRGNWLG